MLGSESGPAGARPPARDLGLATHITLKTGVGEILAFRHSAVLSADDVIDLVGRIRVVYSQRCAARSATRRRSDRLISIAKVCVLPGSRLRHDHDVFELEVILEFRLLFGGKLAFFRARH
jgi:hypothetical protein